jgi:hypothetical protein
MCCNNCFARSIGPYIPNNCLSTFMFVIKNCEATTVPYIYRVLWTPQAGLPDDTNVSALDIVSFYIISVIHENNM